MTVYYFIKAELNDRPWSIDEHLGAYRALLKSTNHNSSSAHNQFIRRLSVAEEMDIVYCPKNVLDELYVIENKIRQQHDDIPETVSEAIRFRYILRQSKYDNELSDGAEEMYEELRAARDSNETARAARLKKELDERTKPSILTRLRYATHLRDN